MAEDPQTEEEVEDDEDVQLFITRDQASQLNRLQLIIVMGQTMRTSSLSVLAVGAICALVSNPWQWFVLVPPFTFGFLSDYARSVAQEKRDALLEHVSTTQRVTKWDEEDSSTE